MHTDCPTPRPKRQAVLVAISAGGHLEAFADKSVDVRFARIPAATSVFGQQVADDCFEMMLPKRYAELWRRDYLRANGTTAPLTAETVTAALWTRDILAAVRKGAA